jgi:hypothetical protein
MTGLTPAQLELLKDDFPPEAYSADNSRGFELTSIKAAYIMERLNDVFGVCGTGWRYAYAPFSMETSGGSDEVMTEIAVQFYVGDGGYGFARWEGMGWTYPETGDWSAPIFSAGGKHVVKGRFTDARKSAITDGLTKAASMLGIGHDVFKGKVRAGKQPKQPPPQRKQTKKAPPQKKAPAAELPSPEAAALATTKQGTKLGNCTTPELQLVVNNADKPDISPQLVAAAASLLMWHADQGPPDDEKTYASIKGVNLD